MSDDHRWACRLKYEQYDRDWVEERRVDYARILYCRGMAFMRLGDIRRGVEEMETAQGFDPGDGAIGAQLGVLRGKLKREELRREGRGCAKGKRCRWWRCRVICMGCVAPL